MEGETFDIRQKASWAAYILAELCKKRSLVTATHGEIADDRVLPEEDDEFDIASDVAAELQTPAADIESKFLNCVAYLLSPGKGYDSVVATARRRSSSGIVIDATRNDCFDSDESSRDAAMLLCEQMSEYVLWTQSEQKPWTTFERAACAYLSARIKHAAQALRDASQSDRNRSTDAHIALNALELWRQLQEKLEQSCHISSHDLALQAYLCLEDPEVATVFARPSDGRLLAKLQTLAKSLSYCRTLWRIAKQNDGFSKLDINLIAIQSKNSKPETCSLHISEAWEILHPESITDQAQALAQHDAKFRMHCTALYDLHAEMQLVSFYQRKYSPVLATNYFGCTKKACFLCHTVLESFPSKIQVYGAHGICYPAWKLPELEDAQVGTVCTGFIQRLTDQITNILTSSEANRKALFQDLIPQSTILSNVPITDHHWSRQQFKEREETLLRRRNILEGRSMFTANPRTEYEPDDCCVMCHVRCASPCMGCRSVWYCSEDCELADRPSHELLCHKLQQLCPRPTPDHRRAIYFPEHDPEPQMIWVRCILRRNSETGGTYHLRDEGTLFGEDDPPVEERHLEHNPVRGRNLGSTWRKTGVLLSLSFRELFMEDGSSINKSVLQSLRSHGTTPHIWRGPMLVMRSTPYELYEDIVLTDFRTILDWLTSYLTSETPESRPLPAEAPAASVRGVRVHSDGHCAERGSDRYVQVDVPRSHPIRVAQFGRISPISKLLGVQIRVREDTDDEVVSARGYDMAAYHDNQDVTFFMTEVDIASPSWGWSTLSLLSTSGTVLAVRVDNQHLDKAILQRMCHFARRTLQPMFEDALGGGNRHRTKQEVCDFITWENMLEHTKDMEHDEDDTNG